MCTVWYHFDDTTNGLICTHRKIFRRKHSSVRVEVKKEGEFPCMFLLWFPSPMTTRYSCRDKRPRCRSMQRERARFPPHWWSRVETCSGIILAFRNTEMTTWDFPGGPVAETSPSDGGGTSSSPSWGARDPICLMGKKSEHKQQKWYCNKFNQDCKQSISKKNPNLK